MLIEMRISWDELTERGRIASAKLDTGRWEIGDLACEVVKEYSKDKMEDFAREIGQKKETVKGYKRVARAFPESVRAKLFEEYPNLFFSHYRTAARLDSPKEQIEFLEESSLNCWTTDECERAMSILLGKPERTETGQESGDLPNSFILDDKPTHLTVGINYIILQFSQEICRNMRQYEGRSVRITITPTD